MLNNCFPVQSSTGCKEITASNLGGNLKVWLPNFDSNLFQTSNNNFHNIWTSNHIYREKEIMENRYTPKNEMTKWTLTTELERDVVIALENSYRKKREKLNMEWHDNFLLSTNKT